MKWFIKFAGMLGYSALIGMNVHHASYGTAAFMASVILFGILLFVSGK